VTSTFVFEGDGRIEEYLGGHEDWQRERARTLTDVPPALTPTREPRKPEPVSGSKKLSYRERLELESLPARIETIEAERARLDATIAGAEFYKESPSAITGVLERAEAVRAELDVLYRRWDELDSKPA
jgi:ATP-binding cassette subfamily F protein uup